MQQQRKVGFVVGNNNYSYLDKLLLSENDAQLVCQTLQSLGFTTKLLLNQTNTQLRHELVDFGEELKPGDLVFFYFSGHAGQQSSSRNNSDNYIFGIDAAVQEEDGASILSGISFNNKILRWLHQDCLYLIVLDACRTYPRTNERYKSASKTRLPIVTQNSLTMTLGCLPQHIIRREYDIIFACQPGYFAIEPNDREHGFLASALCENMSKPGTWADIVIETISKVQQQTSHRQNPSVQLNIGKKIYLMQEELQQSSSSANQNASSSNQSLPSTSASNSPLQSTPSPTHSPRLKMSALTVKDEDLEQISIEDLYGQIQNGGIIQNKLVVVRDRQNNILFDITQSTDQIQLKNIKLISKNSVRCKFLSLHIRMGQTVQFENCDFINIELYIGSQEWKKNFGTTVLKSVYVENAINGVSFYNLNLVLIDGLNVRNCRQYGCNIWDVKTVEMKNVNPVYCELIGVSIKMVEKFWAEKVKVEDCRDGFNINQSSGIILDSSIRHCSCPVQIIKSQVEQRNVQKT